MNPSESRDLATLAQLLRGAFAKPDFARGMTPVISPAPTPEPDLHRWSRVSFGGLPDFQLFVGTLVRSDEGAQAAQLAGSTRHAAVFAAFAELLGGAHPTFEDLKSAPESLKTLQLQGIGPDDGLLVAITDQAAGWLTANVSSTERPGTGRSPIMDALMDVELPVSILLASREASLSDVLQWGPGAIVEFDAGLDDPVEVIVNKQVVARGAVVLVDGNYGVRVTEVLAGPQALGVVA